MNEENLVIKDGELLNFKPKKIKEIFFLPGFTKVPLVFPKINHTNLNIKLIAYFIAITFIYGMVRVISNGMIAKTNYRIKIEYIVLIFMTMFSYAFNNYDEDFTSVTFLSMFMSSLFYTLLYTPGELDHNTTNIISYITFGIITIALSAQLYMHYVMKSIFVYILGLFAILLIFFVLYINNNIDDDVFISTPWMLGFFGSLIFREKTIISNIMTGVSLGILISSFSSQMLKISYV